LILQYAAILISTCYFLTYAIILTNKNKNGNFLQICTSRQSDSPHLHKSANL